MPVDAILNPDPILGITTITISVDTSSEESELDELGLIAYSACLVKEMSLSLKKHQSYVSLDNDENSIRQRLQGFAVKRKHQHRLVSPSYLQ